MREYIINVHWYSLKTSDILFHDRKLVLILGTIGSDLFLSKRIRSTHTNYYEVHSLFGQSSEPQPEGALVGTTCQYSPPHTRNTRLDKEEGNNGGERRN